MLALLMPLKQLNFVFGRMEQHQSVERLLQLLEELHIATPSSATTSS